VCGDTTPHSKPHPAPLLAAAERLALAPAACCYLGDDLRDVQAAHAAGMRAFAVEWGYHGVDDGVPGSWGADAIIASPLETLAHL
jgi:phosphoglycolate phosphatase